MFCLKNLQSFKLVVKQKIELNSLLNMRSGNYVYGQGNKGKSLNMLDKRSLILDEF